MNRILFDKSSLSEDDLNQEFAAYSVPFIFRVVPIAGDDNQCLQFVLSTFYKVVLFFLLSFGGSEERRRVLYSEQSVLYIPSLLFFLSVLNLNWERNGVV